MAKIINPIIVLTAGGGEPNFAKYNITQVINGDKCELHIVDITTQTSNNYFVGQNVSQDKTQLYIVDK